MESDSFFDGYDAALTELFQTSQNQMFSNAGIGTRGFTWTDDSFSSNVHSAQFAGMNTAGVITTRGWSSPSEDFFSVMRHDRHAVSGLYFIDAIPTDGVFLDGVRNGYALVENDNFWPINNKVDNTAETARPDSSHDAAMKIATEPCLDIQTEYQYQNNSGTDGARFGSENLGIAHAVMVSYESGDFRG